MLPLPLIARMMNVKMKNQKKNVSRKTVFLYRNFFFFSFFQFACLSDQNFTLYIMTMPSVCFSLRLIVWKSGKHIFCLGLSQILNKNKDTTHTYECDRVIMI